MDLSFYIQFLSIRFWLAPVIYYYDFIESNCEFLLVFADYVDIFTLFLVFFVYLVYKNLKLNTYFLVFKNYLFKSANIKSFKLPKLLVMPTFFKTLLNRFKKF